MSFEQEPSSKSSIVNLRSLRNMENVEGWNSLKNMLISFSNIIEKKKKICFFENLIKLKKMQE